MKAGRLLSSKLKGIHQGFNPDAEESYVTEKIWVGRRQLHRPIDDRFEVCCHLLPSLRRFFCQICSTLSTWISFSPGWASPGYFPVNLSLIQYPSFKLLVMHPQQIYRSALVVLFCNSARLVSLNLRYNPDRDIQPLA